RCVSWARRDTVTAPAAWRRDEKNEPNGLRESSWRAARKVLIFEFTLPPFLHAPRSTTPLPYHRETPSRCSIDPTGSPAVGVGAAVPEEGPRVSGPGKSRAVGGGAGPRSSAPRCVHTGRSRPTALPRSGLPPDCAMKHPDGATPDGRGRGPRPSNRVPSGQWW